MALAKLETLGLDLAPLATRFAGIGSDLARDIHRLAHSAAWGAAIRARALGAVRPGRHGPNVRFDLLPTDVVRLRRAVRVLGEVMLAAGATEVVPGVHGWHTRVSDAQTMARFERDGPKDPRAYQLAISHMFGTCVMGSDPATSVVRPDFRHHAVAGLYVADSSVFPTNLGVNPQVSIMALATICARSVARR